MSGHIRRARPDERERITEIRSTVQENRLTDPTLERFYRAAGWKIIDTSSRGELIFRAVF
jgi:hypothetical protein